MEFMIRTSLRLLLVFVLIVFIILSFDSHFMNNFKLGVGRKEFKEKQSVFFYELSERCDGCNCPGGVIFNNKFDEYIFRPFSNIYLADYYLLIHNIPLVSYYSNCSVHYLVNNLSKDGGSGYADVCLSDDSSGNLGICSAEVGALLGTDTSWSGSDMIRLAWCGGATGQCYLGIDSDEIVSSLAANSTTNSSSIYLKSYNNGVDSWNYLVVDPSDIQSAIGGITGATNGLTKNGSDVELGGALTKDTTVGNGSQTLTLDVADVVATNTVHISGGTTLGSTLVVNGAATLNSTLSVSNDTSLSGNLDVTSNTVLHGTLNVTGATSLGSTLKVSGAVTLDSVATGSVSTDDVMVITSGGEVRKVAADTLGEDNNQYVTSGISSNTTLDDSYYVVLVDSTGGAVTVTLPASPTTGQAYKIKDSGGDALSNNITISGNGNNIDDATSATINTDYGAIEVVYDGTKWYTLSFVN